MSNHDDFSENDFFFSYHWSAHVYFMDIKTNHAQGLGENFVFLSYLKA